MVWLLLLLLLADFPGRVFGLVQVQVDFVAGVLSEVHHWILGPVAVRLAVHRWTLLLEIPLNWRFPLYMGLCSYFDYFLRLPVSLIASEETAHVVKASLGEGVAQLTIALLQILVRGLVQEHQVLVVAEEPENEDGQDDDRG